MHPIIYDVAVSMDGYIAGPAGDISKFAHEGAVVDDYMTRLQGYACAIMGRATYEFGYGFGMEPGQNPYPHMETVVCSSTLVLPADAAVEVRRDTGAEAIEALREGAKGPIYLCGGGAFAASLLERGQVDVLRLKRAPVVLGGGTPLFAGPAKVPELRHVASKPYEGGYLFQEFECLT